MYANFKAKHKGKELRDAMWACAFATTPNVFKARMEYMKKLSDEAHDDLLKVDPKLWSISHFSTRALCDDLTNNICESFNNYISEARDKPIISMLEWIRLKLMDRFYIKRNGMAKFGGPYCPNILNKLERIKKDASNCFARVSGRLIYQIICADGDHVVNLTERTCTCRMWSVSGIPCKHAVTAIYEAHRDPMNYLHECYGKDAYLKTYDEQIMPIPGETEWIEDKLPPIQPPVIHRPPGRPKKLRKKAADEPRHNYQVTRRYKPVHCGKCHKVGHNSRSCKSSITGETVWQRRMRMKREKVYATFTCFVIIH